MRFGFCGGIGRNLPDQGLGPVGRRRNENSKLHWPAFVHRPHEAEHHDRHYTGHHQRRNTANEVNAVPL
jgi:hypothetical protein